MGEFAAKPTTQLAVQRPSAPTIRVNRNRESELFTK